MTTQYENMSPSEAQETHFTEHIKLKIRVFGGKKGSSKGEPRYGPRTEAVLVDEAENEEKVLDAETFPGMKRQVTWFMKDRVSTGVSEWDIRISPTQFEVIYMELKEAAKEHWFDEAPEPDRELFEWYENKEDVQIEVEGLMTFNSRRGLMEQAYGHEKGNYEIQTERVDG